MWQSGCRQGEGDGPMGECERRSLVDAAREFPETSMDGPMACMQREVCEQLWAALDEEVRRIEQIQDPIERNRQISAAYAKVYQQDERLLWSGVAAFVSKQVGCGMRDARAMLESAGRRKEIYEQAMEMQMRYPAGEPGAAGGIGLGQAIASLQHGSAETLYGGLVNGNLAVFKEIYPVLRFYSQHGLARLLECAQCHDPIIPDELISALEQVEAGDLSCGAEEMLRYEQSKTLQKVVYNDKAVANALRWNRLGERVWIGRLFGAQPIQVNFVADCEGGESVDFDGRDLSNFDERWPYAQRVKEKFDELVGRDRATLEQELNEIIRAAARP
jgi:hypothetical protein